MTASASQPHLLLDGLTDPQRRAATHVDGPLLIVAGAGSGKTRVITRRVAYLLSLGIDPRSILAITFTNKAAGEMKQRISAASPRPLRDWGRLDQPWPIICTFHSLCLRILKHYAGQIGLPPNFTVYDSSDQTRLVKEAMKALEVPAMNFTPGAVHGTISNAKNRLIGADEYAQSASDHYSRTIASVFKKYQQLLAANNALDFDDLLMRAVETMRDHPALLAELQERFRYILIDEYQDTNHAQYVLVHALAMKHRNLCVVGDPDQSIYAWRGADIANILDFEKDYPDAVVIRLEQNYRSTKTILAIADRLISHNSQRKKKGLWTENDAGEKALVLLCGDEHDEGYAVAQELAKLHDQGTDWSRMAIFYRINALSRVIEKELVRKQIPYQIARGVEFYNRKEIKDVLAYLRVISNPSDEVSLTRIVNVPSRGIGDASVRLAQAHAVGAGVSLWQAMQQAGEISGLSTRAVNSMANFVRLIESFRKDPGGVHRTMRSLMEDVVRRSGIEQMLRKLDPVEKVQLANVEELISAAAEYDKENPQGSLDDYLGQVSLVSDVDHMAGTGGAVTLMTLHAAKGLEFGVVSIIGLEEGCLPHSRAQNDADQLEEERRLCFVGITRAQQRLILSKAARRTIRGLSGATVTSQFLAQMPKEMLRIVNHVEDAYEQSEPIHADFHIGQAVKHPTFGLGRIVDLSKAGTNTRAIVDFRVSGRKTLVLEYARLQPAS
ncbi:MAG: UvrD-helicase domain-containing protein [Tepidisphaeraceae bacterium]